MLVANGNLHASPQPGQACRRKAGGGLSALLPTGTTLPTSATLSTGQAPLGRTELSGHGVAGEEVVRGVRHQGHPAAVEHSFVSSSLTQGQRHQEGGLAGSVRPHQCHHFTGVEGQGRVAHQRGTFVVHGEVGRRQHRHGAGHLPRRTVTGRHRRRGRRRTLHQRAAVNGPPCIGDGGEC